MPGFFLFMYALIAIWMVLPFVPEFYKWEYSVHAQFALSFLLIALTSASLDKTNPNHLPLGGWLAMAGIGSAIYLFSKEN